MRSPLALIVLGALIYWAYASKVRGAMTGPPWAPQAAYGGPRAAVA